MLRGRVAQDASGLTVSPSTVDTARSMPELGWDGSARTGRLDRVTGWASGRLGKLRWQETTSRPRPTCWPKRSGRMTPSSFVCRQSRPSPTAYSAGASRRVGPNRAPRAGRRSGPHETMTTAWVYLPPGAEPNLVQRVVTFRGSTVEIPVEHDHYAWLVGGVPAEAMDEPLELVWRP